LATLSLEAGRPDQALEWLRQVVSDHPNGRYPAQALALRGRILQDAGRLEEARNAWERLLAQYPEFLFIDDVRDELRTLP